MFYLLSWFAVASLLALWSGAAWALHAVAAWSMSNAGALSGAAADFSISVLPYWLAPWVPAEWVQAVPQWLAGLGSLVDSLLQAAPALADGLTVAAWLIWGAGSVLLLLLGAELHLLIAVWRRPGGGTSGTRPGSSLAAG